MGSTTFGQTLFGSTLFGSIGATTLLYVPDLAPVGSKAAYFPRDVEQDAAALVFLGFLSDAADANRNVSRGSQAEDINNEGGAWDPAFRAAITRFQTSKGITADSWVGPQTRTQLAGAVAFKNANPGALPPPPPPGVLPPVPVKPGAVPANPAVLPGVRPVSAGDEDDSTMLYVGLGAGALVLAGLAWYALK